MTDAEEQIADLAAQTGLAPAVVVGVCAELAKGADHAQQLELCHKWGVPWPELQRLLDLRPRDLETLGKGLAQQGIMISSLAQGHLSKKLSNPAVVESMASKELSTIAKQQSDIALGWAKEAPVNIGGGNTFNVIGGTIQEIMALKAMKDTEKPALARLIEKGVVIPTNVNQ